MSDTKELVERLRITSNMVNMGEKISWGQDAALMDEAADALERLERERDEWRDAAHLSACEAHSGLLEETEAEASALRARVARLEEALEPMPFLWLRYGALARSVGDKLAIDMSIKGTTYEATITVCDLRRMLAALTEEQKP
ncbi:MAG TPA: hypothetical protein PKV67_01240 [Hyphomonas sp.]|nr:hypothetical protein [Hyphomonas sp.]